MHNAIESGGSQEHYMDLQSTVFGHEIQKEGVTDVMSFITEHAPLFRYFATHLPDDLKESWNKAGTSKKDVERLEAQYERFNAEIQASLEQLDPDVRTALTEAAETGDVDMATKILDAHLARSFRTEE